MYGFQNGEQQAKPVNPEISKTDRLHCDDLFTIYNVQLGKEIGRGLHARIVTAKWNHSTVAIKEVRPSVVDKIKLQICKETFMQECERSSRLSHPNVVKFIGLYYPVGTNIPRLVLEWLHCSLTCRLEGKDYYCHQPLNFFEKMSIIVYVARGLEYFHSQCPPIVHCDLTSDNILLSMQTVAKIGNLGIMRIVDPKSRSQMIRIPGIRDFMPPEVLSNQPQFGPEVDVFSFGCVMLHTLSCQWPTPSEPVETDLRTREQFEVERRQQYLDMLAYDGSVENDQLEVLLYVIQDCLSDLPVNRPKIFDVLEYL